MKKLCFLAAISFLSFNLTWVSAAFAFPPWGDSRESDYRERGEYYDSRDQRNIEREKDRLEWERERLDSERAQMNAERYKSQEMPAPAARAAERCPAGFSESEQKCSNEERKRGCKDMRLAGGLGCVRRGN